MAKFEITAPYVVAHALNNVSRPNKVIYHDKPELVQNMAEHGYEIIDVKTVSKEEMTHALDHIYGQLRTKSDWRFYTFKKPQVDMARDWIATL